MSVSYAPRGLSVPAGFEYILESLAREVLREQPKDIIAFAAEYFKAKLIVRDEGGVVDTPLHKTSTHSKPAQDDLSVTSEPQSSVKELAGEDEGAQSENEVAELATKSGDEEDTVPSNDDQVSQGGGEGTTPPPPEGEPLSLEDAADTNDSLPEEAVSINPTDVSPSDQEQLTEGEEEQTQDDTKEEDTSKDENVEGGVSQDESERVDSPDDTKEGGDDSRDEEPVTDSKGEGGDNEPAVEDNAPAESVDVENTSMEGDPTEPEGNDQPSETEPQEGTDDEVVPSSTSVEGTPMAVPDETEPESTAEGRDSAPEEEKPLRDEPGNEDTDIPTDEDQTS